MRFLSDILLTLSQISVTPVQLQGKSNNEGNSKSLGNNSTNRARKEHTHYLAPISESPWDKKTLHVKIIARHYASEIHNVEIIARYHVSVMKKHLPPKNNRIYPPWHMLKNGLHSNFPTSKTTQKILLSQKFAEIAKTREIPASSDMSINRRIITFFAFLRMQKN